MPGLEDTMLGRLFDDGGKLVRQASTQEPKAHVHTLAIDHDGVQFREDSFQIRKLRGELFEVEGVYVDGSQIWQYPDAIADATVNVTSIYGEEVGPERILRPLFDRQLAEKLSLKQDILNRALRARVKIDLQGKVHAYEFDWVMATVQPLNPVECGNMIAKRKRGQEVIEAVRAIQVHFNFEQIDGDVDPDNPKEHHKIASTTQVILSNLVSSTFANHAASEKLPWIYRTTNQRGPFYRSDRPLNHAYYGVDPTRHFFTDSYHCKISPAFRELVALVNQSLISYYMAGGNPNGVNEKILRRLTKRINQGYDNVEATTATLSKARDHQLDLAA